jgi:acetyl-CoA carboxylase carboxyl transferase alpha subunit
VVDRLLGRARESAAPAAPASTTEAVSVDPEAAVWARVQLARNLRRPRTLELMAEMADEGEWVELHGDRLFGEDEAIVTGLARIDGRRVMVIGHQKGAETEENIRRNFGMPHPEGYRKAMRAMQLAERFRLPVLTFVDTPGAFPGAAAEERGVAEAIARSVGLMSRLRTPIVTVITGEGGSGGALAIAVGDVVIGLENAVYSVISPEGCASILWRTADKAPAAALAMRMSAPDQLALGVLDLVIDEPGDGAHTDHAETARRLRTAIVETLTELAALPIDALLERRYARYRAIGPFQEIEGVPALQPERPTLAGRLQGLFEAGRRTIGESLPARPGSRREEQRREEVPEPGTGPTPLETSTRPDEEAR